MSFSTDPLPLQGKAHSLQIENIVAGIFYFNGTINNPIDSKFINVLAP
jgi:hypothetical protein